MPLIDARRRSTGQDLEADVCIIGAGAAGLSVASQFLGSRTRVLILESGGHAFTREIQDLYVGRVVGQPHAPLDRGRLRYFGGTTNHWTAHVRPLSRLDFEERSWVPYSGWPFDREELDPFYERARAFLGLPQRAFEPERWSSERRPLLPYARERVETAVRQEVLPDKRRFGPRLRQALSGSENVTTCLHANVLRIRLTESKGHAEALEVGTLEGVRFGVRARRFVLATGGIENARLLLLSSIRSNRGRGEDLVGAYFANHPEGWVGYIQPSDPRFTADFYRPTPHASGTTRPFLALSEGVQRQEELLDCWVQPFPGMTRRRLNAAMASERLGEETAPLASKIRDDDVARLAAGIDHGLELPRGAGGPPAPIPVFVIAETVPNPESRVRLGADLDRLGQRRVVLDWRLTPAAWESTERTLRILARETGAAGIGRMRIVPPPGGFTAIRTVASHHHLGTTRMHRDPEQGVVDGNCRMHGIDNLHVAGGSVFPTYGTANPTYTIMALAYRLADHLKEVLRR